MNDEIAEALSNWTGDLSNLSLDRRTLVSKAWDNRAGRFLDRQLTLIQALDASREMISSWPIPWESVVRNYENIIHELLQAYKLAVTICSVQRDRLEELAGSGGTKGHRTPKRKLQSGKLKGGRLDERSQ